MARLIPLLGMMVIMLVAVLLSKNRRAIPWRAVAWGLGLQVLVALCPSVEGLQAMLEIWAVAERLMVAVCEVLPSVAVSVAI